MKLTLSDGRSVEGSVSELTDFINRKENRDKVKKGEFGTNKWYWSDTKTKYLVITEMESHHLRNAINKIYKVWVSKLHLLSPKEYSAAIKNGCQDPTFLSLCRELFTRDLEGDLDD